MDHYGLPESFFLLKIRKVKHMKKPMKTIEPVKTEKNKPSSDAIIAYRKSCNAEGTGLSHFILMDKKAK